MFFGLLRCFSIAFFSRNGTPEVPGALEMRKGIPTERNAAYGSVKLETGNNIDAEYETVNEPCPESCEFSYN